MRKSDLNAGRLMAAQRPRVMAMVLVLGASIVLLISAADYYFDAIRARDAITDREQRASRDELTALQSKAQDLLEQEAAWKSRVVDAGQVQAFQNEVIMAARDCSCRVRKASTGRESHYVWRRGASLYDRFGRGTRIAPSVPELSVTSQSLTVTVVGRYEDIQSFMQKVEGLDRMLGIRSIRLNALGDGEVQLDADVMLFNLEKEEAGGGPRRSRA